MRDADNENHLHDCGTDTARPAFWQRDRVIPRNYQDEKPPEGMRVGPVRR
jgi:hypothetical protein